MTPYELAKIIHTEISSFAPRLSGALNRALLEFGEGSPLVGLNGQSLGNNPESFQEMEQINAQPQDFADIILKIRPVLLLLEENSSWKVVIDKKPDTEPNKIELLYTVFKQKT